MKGYVASAFGSTEPSNCIHKNEGLRYRPLGTTFVAIPNISLEHGRSAPGDVQITYLQGWAREAVYRQLVPCVLMALHVGIG